MIRYADERDFDTLRMYDPHIGSAELQNSIKARRVLVMLDDDGFARPSRTSGPG